jgi:hypothetical protein
MAKGVGLEDDHADRDQHDDAVVEQDLQEEASTNGIIE